MHPLVSRVLLYPNPYVENICTHRPRLAVAALAQPVVQDSIGHHRCREVGAKLLYRDAGRAGRAAAAAATALVDFGLPPAQLTAHVHHQSVLFYVPAA